MKKKPRREGWVERHGKKWRARKWINGKIETVGRAPTEAECDVLLAKYNELVRAAPVAGTTLAAWSERWFEARETDGIHRSVSRDRDCFKRVTRSTLAPMALPAITPKDVRSWVAAQVKAGDGTQTIKNALNLLRVCLRAAVDADLISVNPAEGVRVPSKPTTKETWTWLYQEEITALTKPQDEDADLYTFAIYVGLRRSEIFGLHWTDVDLVRAKATVRFAFPGEPTKNGRVRKVDLLKPVVAALKRQRARWPSNTLVFPARDGEARTRDQMPPLKADLTAAGIKRHVRFHDLRHTCASHLVQGTWAPKLLARALRLEEVMQWMGHRSLSVTQRYAHLSPESISSLVVREAPKRKKGAPKLPPKVASLAEARARKVR